MNRLDNNYRLADVVKDYAPKIESGDVVASVSALVGPDYVDVMVSFKTDTGAGGAVTIYDPRGTGWAVSVPTLKDLESLLCKSLIRLATWYSAKDIRELGGDDATIHVIGIYPALLRGPEVTFKSADGSSSRCFRIIRDIGGQDHRLIEITSQPAGCETTQGD